MFFLRFLDCFEIIELSVRGEELKNNQSKYAYFIWKKLKKL